MTSLQTGPTRLGMHMIAIPAATTIIIFLGYSSQWLFSTATSLAPGPLSTAESIVFNSLLACLWWSYIRACTVDPGRYVFDQLSSPGDQTTTKVASDSKQHIRRDSSSSSGSSSHSPTAAAATDGGDPLKAARWCKKCNTPKPARSHHCRHCRRCVPKMDHHCPWTGNCVSMQTFPHFLRFVVFTNMSLWMLAALLGRRFYSLYAQRHLPAYLGPTLPQLVHLTILGLVCSATLLALTIMLYTTMQAWVFNTTMIEGWEIERHEAVIERYSSTSPDGSWWGDDMEDDDDEDAEEDVDGEVDENDDEYYERLERKVRKATAMRMRVEFPYDLGFFKNMAQSMGTYNVLLWFLPWAGGPKVAPGGSGPGWDWPENGFNDRTGMWPPPDPEKLRYAASRGSWTTGGGGVGNAAVASGRDDGGPSYQQWDTPEEEKLAFQQRQEADFRRRRTQQQQHPIEITGPVRQVGSDDEFEQGIDGEPGWTNGDGDRLRDYGVDEEAENDDDVPIATLLKRRGVQGKKKQ